jgi:hypothetical protein
MIMPGRNGNSNSYRYGFNGQENDNEISNVQGANTTAAYWEYDSRLGRRWNIDPVFKPWQSTYSCLSNSPISRIDPHGDDDYFDSEGNLIKRTKKGANIYVQTAEGNVLLTELPLNSATNRQTVLNIIGYYGSLVGITFQPEGSDQNKGMGRLGMDVHPSGKGSDIAPAWTERTDDDPRGGGNTYINKAGGKICSYFYNYHNLKSALKHENTHRYAHYADETNFGHAQVYLEQIADWDFGLATKDFQIGILGSASKYLRDAAFDIARDGGNLDDIRELVVKFNKESKRLGYEFILTESPYGDDKKLTQFYIEVKEIKKIEKKE